MRERYIILKNLAGPTPATRGFDLPGGGIQAETRELTAGEARGIRDQGGVFAAAPAMPIALIKPRMMRRYREGAAARGSGDALAAENGVAWGVRAVGAVNCGFTGKGVKVAVLDTGINASHPAFAQVKIEQQDFTGEGNGDRDGHGTHCAGTICGGSVDGIRIGVAPGITTCLVGKVLSQTGNNSSEGIVKAMMWAAENDADVISMSLGIDFPGYVKKMIDLGLPPELATSHALDGYRRNVLLFERIASTLRMLAPRVLVIAAAGNESRREERADFEVSASPPAVSEGVLSVAALGRSSRGLAVADFSNTGAAVSAPGVEILSADKDGGLAEMSGTSMATPHVAGVAALWAEKLRAARSQGSSQLLGMITGNASVSELAPGYDDEDVGSGLVKAPQAG